MRVVMPGVMVMLVMVMVIMPKVMGVRMIMGMGVVMALNVIAVIVTGMAVAGLNGRSAPEPPPQAQELRRQQIKADQGDHRVADGFKLVRPSIDLEPACIEPKQQQADQRHGGQSLHCGGDEGDDDPAARRLLVGHHVG